MKFICYVNVAPLVTGKSDRWRKGFVDKWPVAIRQQTPPNEQDHQIICRYTSPKLRPVYLVNKLFNLTYTLLSWG